MIVKQKRKRKICFLNWACKGETVMYKESVLWAVFLKSSKDDINNAFKTIKSLFAQSYNLPKVILSLTDNEIIKID